MTEMVTKEEWVAALRSGEYKQTSGVLCRLDDNGNKSFCCLGVYMDLLEKRGLAESNEEFIDHDDSEGEGEDEDKVFSDKALAYSLKGVSGSPEREVLPPGVDKVSFFPIGNPYIDLDDEYFQNYSIAEINDNGATFAEIADLVEANGLRATKKTTKETT